MRRNKLTRHFIAHRAARMAGRLCCCSGQPCERWPSGGRLRGLSATYGNVQLRGARGPAVTIAMLTAVPSSSSARKADALRRRQREGGALCCHLRPLVQFLVLMSADDGRYAVVPRWHRREVCPLKAAPALCAKYYERGVANHPNNCAGNPWR